MAMACTAAVETVIADHYNNQIRQLMADPEANGELLAVIKKFRDDEMHHHDLAVANEAENAPMYQAVSQAIQFGCRGAIWISERIWSTWDLRTFQWLLNFNFFCLFL